jgi:hypothetical protein
VPEFWVLNENAPFPNSSPPWIGDTTPAQVYNSEKQLGVDTIPIYMMLNRRRSGGKPECRMTLSPKDLYPLRKEFHDAIGVRRVFPLRSEFEPSTQRKR